jgi:ADP-ribose pyrophosphatase
MQEKTLSSETVYSGRVVTLRVDTVELANGRTSRREIVTSRGAVAIVAWDPEGQLLLVRQYRKAVERDLWELPAGTLEPGEDPLHCAYRELQEETGYRAAHIRPLLGLFTSPGFCSEMLQLFEATDLTAGRAAPEEDELIELRHVSLPDAMAMIESGDIVDAKTLVGVLFSVQGQGSKR